MRYQNNYYIINRAASENKINIKMSTEQSVQLQHAESIKTEHKQNEKKKSAEKKIRYCPNNI